MKTALETIYPWVGLAALGASALLLVVAITWNSVRDAWTRANPWARRVFLLAVCGATLFGGAKHQGGTVSFQYTDVEKQYVTDAGSYVTNDYVHIAYALAAGVPNTAEIVVEKRRLDMTNEVDWVVVTNAVARDFTSPQDIACPYATNFNWVVYTTYTPGSAVATNGVWHAYWGLDRKAHIKIVPARSCIRVDGEVIATPKSKWEWEAQQEEDEE